MAEVINCLIKDNKTVTVDDEVKGIISRLTPSKNAFCMDFIREEALRLQSYKTLYEFNKTLLKQQGKPFLASKQKEFADEEFKTNGVKISAENLVSSRSSVGLKAKSKNRGFITFSSYFLMKANPDQVKHELAECITMLIFPPPSKGPYKTTSQYKSILKRLQNELNVDTKNIETIHKIVLGSQYNIKDMPEIDKSLIMHYCPMCLEELKDYPKQFSAVQTTDLTPGKTCSDHKCGLITVRLTDYEVLVTQEEHEIAAGVKNTKAKAQAKSRRTGTTKKEMDFGSTYFTGDMKSIVFVDDDNQNLLFLQETAVESDILNDLKLLNEKEQKEI